MTKKEIQFNENDRKYMRMTLELAEKAAGLNHPNPLVGAVVVRDNKVVGAGWHLYSEIKHAEYIALKQAGKKAVGATLYVNLEPCDHYGRTAPCTDEIIRAGIRRVVFPIQDPDPRVNGSGSQKLAALGIQVDRGLMREKARELNRDYLKTKQTGLPWVCIKVASSLDGKIGIGGIKGELFSSPESLNLAHGLRAWCDAVMVGANTIRIDDPRLTCRLNEYSTLNSIRKQGLIFPKPSSERNPVRITIARNLDIPITSRILDTSKVQTIIFTCSGADRKRMRKIESMGVTIIPVETKGNKIDMEIVLRKLAEMGIMSLLVEGGGNLIASLLTKSLFDEIYLINSPILIGGKSSPGWIEKQVAKSISTTPHLKKIKLFNVGSDYVFRIRPG